MNTKIETKRKVSTHTRKEKQSHKQGQKHMALNLSYLTKKIIMSLKTSFLHRPPQGESMHAVHTAD